MAKDLHHNTLVDALGEQQGGGRVPGVMNANLMDPSRFEQSSPFPQSAWLPIGRPLGWHQTKPPSRQAGPAVMRS